MAKGWRKFAAPGGVALAALMATVAVAPGARAEDAQSYIAQAKALLAKGDLKGAEIELRNAVRESPAVAEPHVELAQIYLKLGNLPAAEAEARLARQFKASPNDVDPLLAQALRRESEFTQLFDLVKPDDRDPKRIASSPRSGLAHLALGEMKEAEPLLRDAERLDEAAAAPKIALTQWMLANDEIDAADAEIKRAQALAPGDPTVLLLESQILIGRNDTDAGLERLNEVLAKNPDDVRALLGRGSVYFRKHDLDAAERDFSHALKASPKNPMAILLDSIIVAQKGNLQKADDMLTEITPVFDVLPIGYYLQGIIKNALGQPAQAEALLTKYLARSPDDPNARRILAGIALRRHDAKSAIQILEPVMDANPTDVQLIAVLAQAYVATGRATKRSRLPACRRFATEQQRPANRIGGREAADGNRRWRNRSS